MEEVLTGDRQIPKAEEFPEHIAPFPETTDELLFSNPTAVVHSPPQKLRPIRCSARSPAIELIPDSAGVLGVGDGGPGQVGSGMGTGMWGDRVDDESSSSTDDDNDDVDDDDDDDDGGGNEFYEAKAAEPMKQKRRRKVRRRRRHERLENFLESLVMKVMERQEQMHKQMVEMIENREKERIAREEAWKQQEVERLKRDEEIRSQETARSLALISFIQNLLGLEIQVPPPPAPVFPEPVVASYDHQCTEENRGDIVKCDPTNKRWPEAEVQALITLRVAHEHKFRITGLKGSIWEEICVGMYAMGYNRSARKCKEKWENINKYFKRSMETTEKKRSPNARICPYFRELELLHKSGLVNPENGFNCINNKHQGNGFICTNSQNQTKNEKE